MLADAPKRLELEYFWAISAEGFAEATVEGIARHTGRETFERLRERIDRLNSVYEDIEPGDRYALTYVPGVGTELLRNGRRPGPPDVASRLVFHVYALVNRLDRRIFYVGKGEKSRVLDHLQDTHRSEMKRIIKKIHAARKELSPEMLAHGLKTAEMAFRIEAAVIDALGLPFLANKVRGSGSTRFGRTPLPELVARFQRKRVTVREPAILVRINQLDRSGMSDAELYDATRGIWKIGPRRKLAKYALAVFEGVVIEVYEIAEWLPAGSTFSTRDERGVFGPGRWEFVGRVARQPLRARYVNRYVGHRFRRGNQSPIVYVNI